MPWREWCSRLPSQGTYVVRTHGCCWYGRVRPVISRSQPTEWGRIAMTVNHGRNNWVSLHNTIVLFGRRSSGAAGVLIAVAEMAGALRLTHVHQRPPPPPRLPLRTACRSISPSNSISNRTCCWCQGRGQDFIWGGVFIFHHFRTFPFLFSPFLLFCPLSSPPRSGPWNPAKGSGGVLLAFQWVGRTTFTATRHVSWALNTAKIRLRPSPGCKRIFIYLNVSVGCNAVLILLN